MLKFLRDWNFQLAIGFGFALGLLFCLGALSPNLENARADTYDHKPDSAAPSQKPEGISFWQRTVDDPINLFTGVLAVLTIALVGTSFWQGSQTAKSIKLARDEFNATHRPEIIVHSVEYITGPKDRAYKSVGVTIAYFNKGVTPAKDIVICAKILSIEGKPEPGIELPELPSPPNELLAGKPYELELFADDLPSIAHEANMRLQGFAGGDVTTNYRCIGTIAYSDQSGARRVTGFCWRLQDTRWVHQASSAYDYAY